MGDVERDGRELSPGQQYRTLLAVSEAIVSHRDLSALFHEMVAGPPRCILAPTPTSLHCTALHTLHCNDAMMQRAADQRQHQEPERTAFRRGQAILPFAGRAIIAARARLARRRPNW